MACGFKHERILRKTGVRVIAGIDEAGRGPLAGPVVAAAVILPEKFRHKTLNDSKKLNETRREEIYAEITNRMDIYWAVSVVDHEEIDRFNILQATHLAMRRAATNLFHVPDHVLIDGLRVTTLSIPHTALVGGDGISFSIAAASVVAKVTRDRIMREMHTVYPDYNFAQHKGYPTPEHLERLETHGPCTIHRKTFLPVAQRLLQLS